MIAAKCCREASCKQGRGLLRAFEAEPTRPAASLSASPRRPPSQRLAHKRQQCASVLPFRSGRCVCEDLLQWNHCGYHLFALLPPSQTHPPSPPLLLFVVISCIRAQETGHLGCGRVQICLVFFFSNSTLKCFRLKTSKSEGFDLRIREVKG